jgi:hypothetical protein
LKLFHFICFQHETYNSGPGTFPNDIAILTLATEIAANGGNIQYALLPRDNSDQFAGRSLVISGWGRDCKSSIYKRMFYGARFVRQRSTFRQCTFYEIVLLTEVIARMKTSVPE